MRAEARLVIIINCYNYVEYVGRAIGSALAQKRDDYDLVVIDDGSTDGSWDVIRQTGVTAYRIENGGQLHACLFGLDRTTAPFVLFLDADDELAPGALDAIMPHLKPSVSKLQFCLSRIDGDNHSLGSAVPSRQAIRRVENLRKRVLKTGVYTSPPTSGNVFRRDLCELLRDADYDDAVDGITILAAPFYGEVVSLPEELGFYRVHRRNKSGVGRGLDRDQIIRHMKRFEGRIDHLKTAIRDKCRGSESLDCRRTFFYAEKQFVLLVLDRDPGRFKLALRLIAITFGDDFPLRKKAALSAFFAVVACFPLALAERLIDIRYRPENRQPAAMLKVLRGRT